MTTALLKLLMAAGAAAFLAVSPVSAQVTGGPGVDPLQDLDAGVGPYKHELRQRFLGAQVPPAYWDVPYEPTIGSAVPEVISTTRVPPEIVETPPDVTGYE